MNDKNLENLEKLEDENRPEACSIEKASNKAIEALEESVAPPEACSIEKAPETTNLGLEKLKELEEEESAPKACSIDTHQNQSDHAIFKDELEIPTFGRNVSVTKEERAKILADLEKLPKLEPAKTTVFVEKDGPYRVEGEISVSDVAIKTNAEGQSVGWKDEKDLKNAKVIYLCRCGRSKNKPFCDQSHVDSGFDGTCTASNEPYNEAANIYKGAPGVYLMDEESLCAIVRFCDPDGSCWNLVKTERTVDEAYKECSNCCSGRLTLIVDGDIKEPEFEAAIEAILDTERDVLGPLWLKGGIPVKTDKTDYEVRNRVTLCRCGYSKNKPFCDGMHLLGEKLTKKEVEENE